MGYFHLVTVMNNAAINTVQVLFGTTLSFLFDVWLRVELLSHLITLFNVFRNCQAVYHFTLTTGVYESYSVSMSSPTFTCLFDGSILRVWICISCFWFAFPRWLIEWNISLWAAIFLHSLQKCLFRFYILRLGNFSFCWVWSVIYILQVQVPSQIYDWQILSPFLGIVFSLSWGLNFKGCRRFFFNWDFVCKVGSYNAHNNSPKIRFHDRKQGLEVKCKNSILSFQGNKNLGSLESAFASTQINCTCRLLRVPWVTTPLLLSTDPNPWLLFTGHIHLVSTLLYSCSQKAFSTHKISLPVLTQTEMFYYQEPWSRGESHFTREPLSNNFTLWEDVVS